MLNYNKTHAKALPLILDHSKTFVKGTFNQKTSFGIKYSSGINEFNLVSILLSTF